MVPLTDPAPTAKERFLRAVEHEFAEFEKRERDFVARERRERAAQLGLPVFLGLPSPKHLSQSADRLA
jgi:hypothetical protein